MLIDSARQTLLRRPDVFDCAVLGLRDDKWGERVSAVVRLHADQTADPDCVIGFGKAQIESVNAPKQVEVRPDLPRSKLGKVLKREIRASLVQRLRETRRERQGHV